MLTAHKIALDLNNKQKAYCAKAAGVARFSYNWALARWQEQYEAHKQNSECPKPSQQSLRRELNAIKREQFPWMLEVTKNAPQMAIIQLGDAFKKFFTGQNQYPKFRKKGVHDRFSLTNDQFSIKGSRIRIPNLGWVRMRETLRFVGKIISATISRVADRWFVSITIDKSDNSNQPKTESQGVVGVDLGISTLATFSNGESINGPKPYKRQLQKIKRLSRSLSRKEKGSQNRKKAQIKLARLHARVSNIRKNALHQLTHSLCSRFDTVCIEDLNVKGMIKNRRLSRAIGDLGFYEFRRQIEYKTHQRGGIVIVADRWFASSKICSSCGSKLEDLPLSVREWTCPSCKVTHHRDVNAAKNLKNLAVSSTVTACGEEGSGFERKLKVKPSSAKQEVNIITTYG